MYADGVVFPGVLAHAADPPGGVPGHEPGRWPAAGDAAPGIQRAGLLIVVLVTAAVLAIAAVSTAFLLHRQTAQNPVTPASTPASTAQGTPAGTPLGAPTRTMRELCDTLRSGNPASGYAMTTSDYQRKVTEREFARDLMPDGVKTATGCTYDLRATSPRASPTAAGESKRPRGL